MRGEERERESMGEGEGTLVTKGVRKVGVKRSG